MSLHEEQSEIVQRCFNAYRDDPSFRTCIEWAQSVCPIVQRCKGVTRLVLEELLGYVSSWWAVAVFKLALFGFRKKWCKEDSPAYNDYLMACWMLRNDAGIVAVLVDRAFSSQLPYATSSSCQWMITSVCGQDEDFRSALMSVNDARLKAHLQVHGLEVPIT